MARDPRAKVREEARDRASLKKLFGLSPEDARRARIVLPGLRRGRETRLEAIHKKHEGWVDDFQSLRTDHSTWSDTQVAKKIADEADRSPRRAPACRPSQ